jgi:hypothetical protein
MAHFSVRRQRLLLSEMPNRARPRTGMMSMTVQSVRSGHTGGATATPLPTTKRSRRNRSHPSGVVRADQVRPLRKDRMLAEAHRL